MSLEPSPSSLPDLPPSVFPRHLHLAPSGVALLRWPDEEAQRARLAADELPRLLLISRSCLAPECVDELEDWIREPLDHHELECRSTRLRHRAGLRAMRPRVDDSGLVRAGDRWVALPPLQLAVARVLIGRVGRVVTAETIQVACRRAGGSDHPKAVKAVIGRVRTRLAELDLTLTNVRDRGYVLGAAVP
jgi:two-component system, OmpR family, response regulator